MATLQEALALAVHYHQAGQLREAEQIYRQVLQADPARVDALHLLGVLTNEIGRPEQGLAYIQQALRLSPMTASIHYNEGVVYQALGKHGEAAASYQRALRLNPEQEKALNNLGLALASQGEKDRAAACFAQALRLQPAYAEAHYNLANLLAQERRLEEAIVHYGEALHYRPDWGEVHNNLGNALVQAGRLPEAHSAYRAALRIQPNHVETLTNLGNLLAELGQREEALASYERALALKSDHALAHWNRSLVWLTQGDYARGWPAYEWRHRCPGFNLGLPIPHWDGSPPAGRRVLLCPQGGLGDTLQFIRYALPVQESGGRVIAWCQPEVAALLESCPGVEQVVPLGAPLPAVDLQVSLLSLPFVFRTLLSSIPDRVPYLCAPVPLIKLWHDESRSWNGLKIGIAWQGNKQFQRDERRSAPLAAFAPLAELPGVRLFSLQKGPGQEQLAGEAKTWRIIDLGNRLPAFADTAAVLANLDLVITVDTSVAHCAGALGVPAWVLLTDPPDWRWLLAREDSPWYPSIRLFRQRRWGDWGEVLERVASELKQWVAGSRTPAS